MAIRKRNLLIPFLPLAVLALCGITAMNVNFKYIHPMYANAKFTLVGGAGPKLVIEEKHGMARVEIDHELFDFGVMNPLTEGRHSFVIRNTGTGTLRLNNQGASCKCTVADVESALVEPGEQTQVDVVFNTGRDRVYFQTVTLGTNDMTKKTIRLQIRGDVRVQIDAEPRSVDFGTVDPRSDLPIQRMLVYSRTLRDLRVLKGTTTVEGIQWSVDPASDHELTSQEATGAVWLTLIPPPVATLFSGPFTAVLELEVEGVDEEEQLVAEKVRVGVGGKVVRRLAVYGETINSSGEINLGNLRQGEGKRARLLVKVRDQNTQVDGAEIKVIPDFVKASWSQKSKDLYVLDLEVPPNAPVGDYSGNFAGSVMVTPAHESIKPETFKFEFDVIKR